MSASSVGPKLDLASISRAFFDNAKLSAIMEQVGAAIEAKAEADAPYLTGALRNSGFHRTTGLKVVIGFTAEHAEPVEMGHVTKSGSFVAARPYLLPAVEDGRDNLLPSLITKHAQTVLGRA